MDSQRNIYKEDIDFSQLAREDADFAECLKPGTGNQLNFTDPASVQQLTKSLLKRDFNLKITLPSDRLCPPVPNRLNYLLWIQDLLDTTSESYLDRPEPKREVIGFDIGTGASCIYPLLGCAQYPAWKFAASDIDELSLSYAKQNIDLNCLESRIKLHKSLQDGPLLPLDALGLDTIDFCMCNPPFYTTHSELLHSAAIKRRPPNTACTGSANEMIYPGGEVAFVTRMILESVKLKDRVQWYTSMLGKYSSVDVVVEKLRGVGVGNYAVMEFVQGNKTRRWGVAWSFEGRRPRMKTARGIPSLPKGLLPFPSEYLIIINGTAQQHLGSKLNESLSELDLQWQWKADISTGVGFSSKNVWSRAARRKTARTAETEEDDEDEDDDDMPFGFKISLAGVTQGSEVVNGTAAEEGVELKIRWLKGFDSVLFESFCGMVKRKIEA